MRNLRTALSVNNAYTAGQIDVTDEAQPFPRPIGDPQLYHGSGNPEGLVYAPQSSVYMRKDGVQANGGVLYMKTTGITQSTGWLDLATASGATAVLPPGLVTPYAGATAPTGWLICDGSAISRTTYSLLFTTIGTSYGSGDGSTTFNLPDLRGRIPVGYAATGGHSDVSALGNNDGIAEQYRRPAHRHTPHSHGFPASPFVEGPPIVTGSGSSTNPSLATITTTSSADGGSGNGSDSLDAPAWLVVNYIIKT